MPLVTIKAVGLSTLRDDWIVSRLISVLLLRRKTNECPLLGPQHFEFRRARSCVLMLFQNRVRGAFVAENQWRCRSQDCLVVSRSPWVYEGRLTNSQSPKFQNRLPKEERQAGSNHLQEGRIGTKGRRLQESHGQRLLW